MQVCDIRKFITYRIYQRAALPIAFGMACFRDRHFFNSLALESEEEMKNYLQLSTGSGDCVM